MAGNDRRRAESARVRGENGAAASENHKKQIQSRIDEPLARRNESKNQE